MTDAMITPITLLRGDCLEILPTLADNSVDCIITDPPYKLVGGGHNKEIVRFAKLSSAEVSKGKFFEIPETSIWMQELYRVLRNGGQFYCMTNDKNLHGYLSSAKNARFHLLNILVWDKGMATPIQYYRKDIEFILFMCKGKAEYIRNMGDTALIRGCKGIYGTKVHPSEKPINLMERFVCNSTDKNGVVLDPFMGSGSTMVACANTGRRGIGIELMQEYYDIAVKRVKDAQAQLKLDLAI